ncbi:MAG: DMT family transporter [Clostridium sp.]|uniref:DMT family transporter n=1 Tax=Clostridium saudiense TaxID=1414720 RepID=A0ABS2FFT9_9CLOT|nr:MULTISPECIES: DMT family transporter [Clostridiaceae]MBM6819425.1 DMT family transporter [Clostridium saudiense]MBQ8999978.1 DMT family transporter [Clostridium sp.]
MFGFIIAIISGIAMSVQGVFNTKLSDKIGTWETNTIVQGSALVLTLIILFFFGNGNFKELKSANKLYLLGGALGVVITFTVILSIKSLGTTVGIGTILIAQLLAAALIDAFGLFGSEKVPFSFHEILGIVIMIAGIVLFKWKF